MQDRYVKDLAIALGVILLIVFGIRNYFFYHRIVKVPAESRYSQLALSEELLERITQIEESIQERKQFRFTVRRDPLKQDLIVQTRLDLLKEWEEMVRRMMRLTAIIEDDMGNQKAIIAWDAKNTVVGVGDIINNKRITRITDDRVEYTEAGKTGTLTPQPIPPKPPQLERGRTIGNR